MFRCQRHRCRAKWVAHNLERIADRATNICERVVFADPGEVTEINASTF
jgi:phosphate transport system protein